MWIEVSLHIKKSPSSHSHFFPIALDKHSLVNQTFSLVFTLINWTLQVPPMKGSGELPIPFLFRERPDFGYWC